MAKTSLLFEHTQRYIREVMADRLREEGFVSYKGEDIHWYRLVNNEVVHAIYFVTRHTALNAFFEINYGCHPLFIPPVFQKSPYYYTTPGYEQMSDAVPEIIPGSTPYGFDSLLLLGLTNRCYRVPDVLINCPRDKNNGLDILEKVFPVMDGLQTPVSCYEMHKRLRKREIETENMWSMSSYFVDEVLFWEDKAIYSFCQKYIENQRRIYENLKRDGVRTHKSYQANLERCLVLNKIFEEDRYEEYLQTFHEREQKTLRDLERYTAIRRRSLSSDSEQWTKVHPDRTDRR